MEHLTLDAAATEEIEPEVYPLQIQELEKPSPRTPASDNISLASTNSVASAFFTHAPLVSIAATAASVKEIEPVEYPHRIWGGLFKQPDHIPEERGLILSTDVVFAGRATSVQIRVSELETEPERLPDFRPIQYSSVKPGEPEYISASDWELEVVEMDENVLPSPDSEVLKADGSALVHTSLVPGALSAPRLPQRPLRRPRFGRLRRAPLHPPRLHQPRRPPQLRRTWVPPPRRFRRLLRPPLRRPWRVRSLRQPQRHPPRPPRLRRLRHAPLCPPRLRRPRRGRPPMRGCRPRLRARVRLRTRASRVRIRHQQRRAAHGREVAERVREQVLRRAEEEHAEEFKLCIRSCALRPVPDDGDVLHHKRISAVSVTVGLSVHSCSFVPGAAMASVLSVVEVAHNIEEAGSAKALVDITAPASPRALHTRCSTLGRSHNALVVIDTRGKSSVLNSCGEFVNTGAVMSIDTDLICSFSTIFSAAYDTLKVASDFVASVPSSASATAMQIVPVMIWSVPMGTDELGASSHIYVRPDLNIIELIGNNLVQLAVLYDIMARYCTSSGQLVIECKACLDARLVFDKMPRRYSTSVYSSGSNGVVSLGPISVVQEAPEVFDEMSKHIPEILWPPPMHILNMQSYFSLPFSCSWDAELYRQFLLSVNVAGCVLIPEQVQRKCGGNCQCFLLAVTGQNFRVAGGKAKNCWQAKQELLQQLLSSSPSSDLGRAWHSSVSLRLVIGMQSLMLLDSENFEREAQIRIQSVTVDSCGELMMLAMGFLTTRKEMQYSTNCLSDSLLACGLDKSGIVWDPGTQFISFMHSSSSLGQHLHGVGLSRCCIQVYQLFSLMEQYLEWQIGICEYIAFVSGMCRGYDLLNQSSSRLWDPGAPLVEFELLTAWIARGGFVPPSVTAQSELPVLHYIGSCCFYGGLLCFQSWLPPSHEHFVPMKPFCDISTVLLHHMLLQPSVLQQHTIGEISHQHVSLSFSDGVD